MGFFDFFKSSKPTDTKPKKGSTFWQQLRGLFGRKQTIDDDLLDELEELLVTNDIGIEAVEGLLEHLKQHSGEALDAEGASALLKREIVNLIDLPKAAKDSTKKPHVILLVGVNGAGKTTTTAKLAHHLSQQRKKVLLAPADTFRAGAVEQLTIWAKRLKVDIVEKQHPDPSTVIFEGMTIAQREGYDILLIDTAGRLHNKENLMRQLDKIKRVIQKKEPTAPHETLLVIDGSTGQNALQQAKHFQETLPITGTIVTKLDGIAKGGSIITIPMQLAIPIQYVGVGEKLEDLVAFDPHRFVEELLRSAEM